MLDDRLAPSSLVGEVMAYQDDAGLLSVKHSVTPAMGSGGSVLRDSAITVHCPGGNSGTADRPLESRWPWWCVWVGLLREVRADWCSEATSGTRHVCQRMQSHSVRTQAQRSFGTAARARFGLGLPFLREGAGRGRRSGATSEPLCRMPESRLSWRWRCAGSSLGKMRPQLLQRTGGDSGPATPSARVPPVVVYDIVTCLLREAASGVVVAGGNSSAATSRRESRLSWRLDACRGPFGGSGADPEPWSLLQSCHVLRESEDLRLSWPGCIQRLLREPADSSRRLESSSSAATPRATIRRSQRQRATSPFGRPGVLTPPSGDAIQTFGRALRPSPSGGAMRSPVRRAPLSGGTQRHKVRQQADRASLGRRGGGAAQRRQPATPMAVPVPPGVPEPAQQWRSDGRRGRARVPTMSTLSLDAPHPRGRGRVRRIGCLQLRCELTRSYFLCPCFSCLRCVRQVALDCNRSIVGGEHPQSTACTVEHAARPAGRAQRSNAAMQLGYRCPRALDRRVARFNSRLVFAVQF